MKELFNNRIGHLLFTVTEYLTVHYLLWSLVLKISKNRILIKTITVRMLDDINDKGIAALGNRQPDYY